MYTLTDGMRTMRIAAQPESHKSARWWVTDDGAFSDNLIDAFYTLREARKCAIAELETPRTIR